MVQIDHSGQSYLLGIDAATGANRWRTLRDASVNWSSPLPVRVGGKTQIVTVGTYAMKSYALDTGSELWSIQGMMHMQCIPTPVASGDRLFTVGGRDFTSLAIRLDNKRGDWTKTNVAWKVRSPGVGIPSPLVLDGLLYYVEDSGFAVCRKADTGERVWRERLGGGKYSASPVAADGKIYFTSESGTVVVVKTGAKFEIVARNDVGELVVASPALSHGRIFLAGTSTCTASARSSRLRLSVRIIPRRCER